MKNLLISWGIELIWLAVGRLGSDLLGWMADADKLGLNGRAAFDFVWRKAKGKYSDIGDWLLNLLIETGVGKQSKLARKLTPKLKWPKKLSF